MKKLTPLILATLLILSSGCSFLTNEFTETNALIAESNLQSRKAYADSLAACGSNAACQVGVTSSYFSNAGQQPLIKPETPVDYLNAGLPYATLGANIYMMGKGTGGTNKGGITLVGDNNVLNDVGSNKAADNGSTITGTNTGSTEKVTNVGDGSAKIEKSPTTTSEVVFEPEVEEPMTEDPATEDPAVAE